MHYITGFFHFIFHLHDALPAFIDAHGNLIYLLFFIVIFIETGIVIMPFLPGDSLLFIAGSFAAIGQLNVFALIGLLFVAAVLGDNSNYFIGKFFGHRATKIKLFGRNLIKQKNIDKTHGYFEKYGVRTIIIARFVPIVRTITPFVAGIGEMKYSKFLLFDIFGGALWISSMTMMGYFFGQVPFIAAHPEAVAVGIIFISILPMIVEIWRNTGKKS
ncbi:MAG: VTT domain-containing protein [Bacteroidetes bacterium]|nr:VTT domain-containing protein [Bacteroidota bacterium]